MTWRVATYPSRFFRTLWSLRALSLAQRTAAARSTAAASSAVTTSTITAITTVQRHYPRSPKVSLPARATIRATIHGHVHL